MSKLKKLSLCLLSLVVLRDAVHAEQSKRLTEPPLAKYVNISFEIYGLEEAANTLTKATTALLGAMERLKSDAKHLEPKQLDQFESIARETNGAIRSLTTVLQEAGHAIENARGPTRAMLSDVLSVTKESTIDPTLKSINDSITKALESLFHTLTKWLLIVAVATLAALFMCFWWLLSITRRLKSMADQILLIANDYELVRKRPASDKA